MLSFFRSGHQGKNCPGNNRCGINDFKDTHHFNLHFERPSNPPERVDAAVETRTVPVWLVGSEGQNIQVSAFLDDGSDSTYVRNEIVTAVGLKTEKKTLRLTTLTESCISLKGKKVSLTIKSLNGETQSTVKAWTFK